MALHSPAELSLKEKLRDPAYLERHLVASHALVKASGFGWYDSQFLRCHDAAKTYLAEINPQALDTFLAGFAPLHPPAGFEVPHIVDFLSEDELASVRAEVAAMPHASLSVHEIGTFGRHVVHDHPPFVDLQQQLTARVSDLVGVALEPCYNFLSLYGPDGDCKLHMDQPFSMFTLDLCIDQSHEWPIHFSNVIDWSTDTRFAQRPTPESLQAEGVQFTAMTLHPNEAIVFCGVSQWHYRRPFAQEGFCNLLFLHYFPVGLGDLVDPLRWASHFAMPELQPLCDLFAVTLRSAAQEMGPMA